MRKAQSGGRRLRVTDANAAASRHSPTTWSQAPHRGRHAGHAGHPYAWYRRRIAREVRREHATPTAGSATSGRGGRTARGPDGQENPTWGYRRLPGALANLGQPIDKIDRAHILCRHHMDPAPTPQGRDGLGAVPEPTRESLAATDFFTVEVATWHGLVTYYVLVVRNSPRGVSRSLASRRIPPPPSCNSVLASGGSCEGFLAGQRLPHPRQGHEMYAGV